MSGKVRYVGDYYKVMFEKGEIYDLLGIETAPFGEGYRVYSPNFDDDGVFPKSEFEIVEPAATITVAEAEHGLRL